MMRAASELLRKLNATDESASIEAKRGSEVGKSLLETVIAFANELGLISDKPIYLKATGLPRGDCLFPTAEVSYVRVVGTEWVADPERRFAATLDVRKGLLLVFRQIAAAIEDELPKEFYLET